jgi:ribosome-associated protein
MPRSPQAAAGRPEAAPRLRAPRKAAKAPSAPASALDFAHRAIDAVEDKKATQIVLLDVHAVSMFTDYFLLCNGESERQIKAIVNGVDETLGKSGLRRLGLEGTAESGWVLLDFGDVMVHVFTPERRAYYKLEELWKDGQTVVKIQ